MNRKTKYILTIIILIASIVFIAKIKVDEKYVIHQHLIGKTEVKTEDVEEFNTHLPFISIETGGKEIPGEARDGSTIEATIKIFDKKEGNNFITDEPQEETLANINYRGASSMSFDKKGYSLKFIKENGEENKVDALGMGKHDEWVLNGPFLDKTLIRNYMWYNISAEIMEYSPEVRFCELFVDNEYKGIYILLESISRGENNRVTISQYDEDNEVFSYIIRLDRGSSTPLKNVRNFTKYTLKIGGKLGLDIKYPGTEKITKEKNRYIAEDVSKFEKALYSFDYKEYKKYIDVQSFVDYFIINEFTQNYDAGNLSTFLYKDSRGKYKFAVWDFNSACDNYRHSTLEKDFDFQNNVWYEMLLRDPEFTEKIVERYHELRKTYLNEEYLLNYIDETIAFLGDAKDRNFEIWGYTFLPENDLLSEERKIGSYEQAIEKYKSFIIQRGRWLDDNIEQLYQFSHPSVNKKYNH